LKCPVLYSFGRGVTAGDRPQRPGEHCRCPVKQVHALYCSGGEGRQVCTLICDVELPSQHIGVLVLGIRPREFAGIAVPKGPALGLAGHKLVKVEGRELLQVTTKCTVAFTAPPGIPRFASLGN
jgi:hypothetical protein